MEEEELHTPDPGLVVELYRTPQPPEKTSNIKNIRFLCKDYDIAVAILEKMIKVSENARPINLVIV